MTVRELWNDFLDLQVWQALLLVLFVVLAGSFMGGFGRALADDLRKMNDRRRDE